MILALVVALLQLELRRLEAGIDRQRFDRVLSRQIDRVVAALEVLA